MCSHPNLDSSHPWMKRPHPALGRWLRIIGLIILAGRAVPAAAHPLGNFTINRYSRLELTRDRVRIHYIVDMAEIPAFQELGRMDADGDGTVSPAERRTYLAAVADSLRRGLDLVIDGRSLATEILSRDLATPPGQAGLQTLRLQIVLQALLPRSMGSGSQQARFRDTNYDQRLGWKEIVVNALSGVRLLACDVPQRDRSDALRHYPQDQLTAPLDVRRASWTFAPATPSPDARRSRLSASRTFTGRRPDRLAALMTDAPMTVPVILVSLLMATGLGALHALSPGHGKALVGAYLVGTRGTARHALILGFTVTLTHTAGVFALGLITLWASRYLLPERLYPWLGCASGLIVAGMGAGLLRRRLHAAAGSNPFFRHEHGHGHDHSAHGPFHTHSHGEGHTHGFADQAPTWRSLLALGISGGLLPCPSALVVLLGAMALHRIGFGMLLIVAFSLGLAAVLTVVGLLFVYACDLVRRFPRSQALLKHVPALSAAVIAAAGLGIALQGVWQVVR
jgi:nickel/cobalt transporter (NicO) family protein